MDSDQHRTSPDPGARPVRDDRRTVAVIGTRGYPSYYGGFETAVRAIAPYLADRGWNVRVYCRKGETAQDDPRADPNVDRVFTPGIPTKLFSTLTFGLTSFLHASVRKPDVALVMNVANGFWLPILKWRGVPTIVNVDGIEWEREKWGRLARMMFRWGARLTARYADHLIFDARAIEELWGRRFGRSGTYIPYGGQPDCDRHLEDDLEPGRYVLLVARFVPENTIGSFLDAAEEISREFDVVIVGRAADGHPINQRVTDLAERNERIHWLGHVENDRRLHALWSNAGAYFHGHSAGGTNPSLVQAMALGAPIVALDTIYNREVLSDAGRFVTSEPASIAAGLASMIREPGVFPRRAAARAAALYTWPDVCRKYHELLLRHVT